ncbi:MAG: hypothetical protein SFU27_07315 [Thermonemataceae bacterium]|nr:hypothetical protein [Thermonemataceae bacterium]
MYGIEHLLQVLDKHNIAYEIETNSEILETKISIFFQSSFKTLKVAFQKPQSFDKSVIKINFVGEPESVDFVIIHSSEWEIFVEQMIVKSYTEEDLNQSVFQSWTRQRTDNLLIFDNEKEASEMYFLGLDQADKWGFLHQKFVTNSFIQPICKNEAGKEGEHWGAAQYKTAYSNSFINYEGIIHGSDENRMLFFLSCSYLPNKFGVEKLKTNPAFSFKLTHDKSMPIDLVLAIETLGFPLMDKHTILKEIADDSPDAPFFTYVMLSYFGTIGLLSYIPEIIRNKNKIILDYLRDEYFRMADKETIDKFLLLID